MRFASQLARFLTVPVVTAGLCVAPQPPPDPPAEQWTALAEAHLNQRLASWQQRLLLDEWSISIEMSSPDQLRPGTLGNIRWDETGKTARIRVLDAPYYEMSYQAAVRDMEFTVVHELLHLELASLPRSEASRSDEEVAVNRVAEALLELNRSK